MKTYFSIFILAAMVAVWGCNSKKEKTAEEIAFTEDSLKRVEEERKAAELAEHKAQLKTARDAKAEQRRMAWDEKTKKSPSYKDKSGKTVYYKGETDPTYTGGEQAMVQYLRDNLKYPEAARSKGQEGTVWVDFVVDSKGKVREVSATESTWDQVDPELVNEAVRVVTEMPTWKAGTKGGKPVDIAYNVPITFELESL